RSGAKLTDKQSLLARRRDLVRICHAQGQVLTSLSLPEARCDVERPAIEWLGRGVHAAHLVLHGEVVRHEQIVWKERDRSPIVMLAFLLSPGLEHPRAEHVVRAVALRCVDDRLSEEPFIIVPYGATRCTAPRTGD